MRTKQNKHKEYYIIETNGNLGMYDPEGKFAEAVKKKENIKITVGNLCLLSICTQCTFDNTVKT